MSSQPVGGGIGRIFPGAGGMLEPCWPMLAPCWLHVGSMLAHVGFMLAHDGPSGLQDGSRCHCVDSGWPQDGQHGLQEQILINFWLKIAHFGTPWTVKILKKSIGFKGPFAFCTFLVSLIGFWVSKLPQVASKLAQVGLLEQIWGQVEPSWLQVGSSWIQVGPKLAPCWLMLGPCWGQVGSKSTQVDAMLVPIPWSSVWVGPVPPQDPPLGTIYKYIVQNTELK